MEHQSLIPSPNDDGKKQKKGSPPLLVMVSTALLLLGLAFYGGVYRHRLGYGRTHQTRGSVVGALFGGGDEDYDDDYSNDGVIPIGGDCYYHRDHCAIPLGFQHGLCMCYKDQGGNSVSCECTTGQPGALCAETSDCVVPPELDHAVCRDSYCQSGQPGAPCGVRGDCVVITDSDPPHAVCRNDECQSGKSGALCGVTEDCIVPSGLDHAVCRHNKCQKGVKGDYCGQDNDCLSGMKCHGIGDSRKCK